MADNTYTFLTAQNKLSSLLGDPRTGTDNQFPLADRKQELNNAEIQFARDSMALLNKVTGTVASMAISLPDGYLKIWALYVTVSGTKKLITNDREVSIMDLERYANYSGSVPFYYVWKESGTWKVNFLGGTGLNGSAYELYLAEKPTTALDGDSDESEHDIENRPAIPFKAAAELLLQIGQYARAAQLLGIYSGYVSKANDEVGERFVSASLPIVDTNYIG